jgi:hypothetical protein
MKGYDYSQEGLYFITICCFENKHLFGRIEGGVMVLNEAGKIAERCWEEIPEHFRDVVLHAFVIMPNHVHGILEIVGAAGAGAKKFSPVRDDGMIKMNSPLPHSPSRTIGSVVRGFKIGVTKWMRQNTEVVNVWHRNYYDIIIRNEQSYDNISNYIINNPINWRDDRFLK